MTRGAKIALVAGALAVVLAAAGIAMATGDDEAPLSGDALRSVSEAALVETGGGQVVETEVGDGEAAYEVEVRLPDGSVVEVQLDDSFTVIGSEPDDDVAGEEEPDED